MAKIKKQTSFVPTKTNGVAKDSPTKNKNKNKLLLSGQEKNKSKKSKKIVQGENGIESISIQPKEEKLKENDSKQNVILAKKVKKRKHVDVLNVPDTEKVSKKKQIKQEMIVESIQSPPIAKVERKKAKKLAIQKEEGVSVQKLPGKSEKKDKKSKNPTVNTISESNGNSVKKTPEEIEAARKEKRFLRKQKRAAELKSVGDVKKPSSFSIFVGNLPVNTKRPKVFRIFSKFGKINSIRFRLSNGAKFFKSKSKVSSPSVISFVDFEKEEDAKSSLVMNGEKVKENVIRVNMQDSVKNTSNFDSKRTVFAGNLKYSVTDQILYDFFACCGDIEYARTMQCEKGCNGGSFVCFKKPESVGMALELNNTDLLGRPVRVERYVKKDGTKTKKKEKLTGGARRVEQKEKKADVKNEKSKNPKKEFTGTKSNDKKKNIKKKKILKGPKLLAKKIAHREKVESP